MAFVSPSAVPLAGRGRGAAAACAQRGTSTARPGAVRHSARGAARHPARVVTGASRARATRAPRMDAGASGGAMTLEGFLEEAAGHALSTMRFITVSPSAVLETVGRLDYGVTPFQHPTKGRYVTLSSADKMFELHVCVSAVRSVTLSTSKAKIGDHDLHVIRFRDGDGGIVFSALLQYDPSQGPGHYLAGAVDAFNALRDKVGAEVTLAVDDAAA